MGQLKGERYMYRLIENEADLDDWIDNERGARAAATEPSRDEDIAALYRQIKDLMDMRKVIQDDHEKIKDLDVYESQFIQDLQRATVAYATKLDTLWYLPEAWREEHLGDF